MNKEKGSRAATASQDEGNRTPTTTRRTDADVTNDDEGNHSSVVNQNKDDRTPISRTTAG